MNGHPSLPAEDPAARAQAVLWRQVEMLEQLAEEGLRLARAISSCADEAPPERPEAVAMAFSRVARAVRMTALLQSRLLKDMDEARRRDSFISASDREAAAEAEARLDPAYGHKARVEAIVERIAKAGSDDEDRIERIVRETAERLDDEDIYGDVLARPVGELVALICRDLGLTPDWGRLCEEAWAQDEIRSGARGSPLASMIDHQGCQGRQEESPSEGNAIGDRAARLGALGSLGGSTLLQDPQKAVHSASP